MPESNLHKLSALGVAAKDGLADQAGLLRVVDPHLVGVGAEVHQRVPGEHVEHRVSEMDATVVECNRHLHVWTVPHRRQSTRPAS